VFFDHRLPGLVVAITIDGGEITSAVFVGPTGQRWTCTGTLPRFRHLSERWPPAPPRPSSLPHEVCNS